MDPPRQSQGAVEKNERRYVSNILRGTNIEPLEAKNFVRDDS
jgi:hypothetical protein